MQNPNHIIMRYSAMTGIRDPRVDAWVQNQELYKKHGMAHPSLEKKSEPERRSRSPMLPGPRKVESHEGELFEKYLREHYPLYRDTQLLFSGSDIFTIRDEPWSNIAQGRQYWPEWVGEALRVDRLHRGIQHDIQS